jgi:phenylalanyl-tRNA synthetase alpha subunit
MVARMSDLATTRIRNSDGADRRRFRRSRAGGRARRALGKKGSISALLATLGKMSPDERKTGRRHQLAKDKVTEALTARRDMLKTAALDARLASETVDVTLPTARPRGAGPHPSDQRR